VEILDIRFVPSLAGLIYHGDKVTRAEIRRKFMPKTIGPDFPIIITSYEMAMSDAKFLAHYNWKYVVVDEVIKSTHSEKILIRGQFMILFPY
jgi:ATP-dependent DNA helicase